jgi:hypothetical protein
MALRLNFRYRARCIAPSRNQHAREVCNPGVPRYDLVSQRKIGFDSMGGKT